MNVHAAVASAALSALGLGGGAAWVTTVDADGRLDAAQVAALASTCLSDREDVVTATAIGLAESSGRPSAQGDTTITDGTWGPSVGIWQVRSLWSERGTGGTRDADRLEDPEFNARSMCEISGGGDNWRPWSVYTNGAYEARLGEARQAVDAGGGVTVEPVGLKVETLAGSDGLDDDFSQRLARFAAAAPGPITISSGFRSTAEQQSIIDRHGGECGYMVACVVDGVCKSNHCQGRAADLAFGDDAVEGWAHDNADRFGLVFPMSWEPWHVEPNGDPAPASNQKASQPAAPTTTTTTTRPTVGATADRLLEDALGGWDKVGEMVDGADTPILGRLYEQVDGVVAHYTGQ